MRVVLVDGVARPDGRLELDVDDPGLMLGLGVFETLRTYGGRPFRLGAHLDRLEASARALGAPCPRSSIEDEIGRALEAWSPGVEANVRVTLLQSGRRVVRVCALSPVSGPARCALLPWEPAPSLPGWIKHTSRAASALAIRPPMTEALRVDRQGYLLEGTRSNIIGVQRGVLRTPPLDGRILAGVTRLALLEVAAGLGLPIDEAPVPAATPFDELYVCSTLRELQAVVELDGRPAPGAGPVGARLIDGLAALIAAELGAKDLSPPGA